MEINTINKNATTNGTDEPRGKLIFNPVIARELIRAGFRVIDLKQNRQHPEQSVVVIEDSLEMRDKMQEIIKKRRAARKARTEAETEKEPILQED